MQVFRVAAALMLTSSFAFAQDFSTVQGDAVEDFWDASFACAADEATCAEVGAAVRAVVTAGLCPVENRFEPCEPGSIELPERLEASEAAETTPADVPSFLSQPELASSALPPLPSGLTIGEPEVMAAIARGECLTATGFGECRAYTPPRLAANGHLYEGISVDETRMLSRWMAFSIECRGAASPEDIAGWCAARDDAIEILVAMGLCLYAEPINGFRSCAPAGSAPETVPFDDTAMREAFSALPSGQRKFIQGLTSAGGTDGGYGSRTAEALRRTARLLEDLTARDPQPYRFDLSTPDGAHYYVDVLQRPLTEAIIWGGH